jgi:hypothetical protein
MKASEIVMLIWRTLHFWRAAISSIVMLSETISSSHARPRAMEFDRPHAVPFGSRRQQDLLEPLRRRRRSPRQKIPFLTRL